MYYFHIYTEHFLLKSFIHSPPKTIRKNVQCIYSKEMNLCYLDTPLLLATCLLFLCNYAYVTSHQASLGRAAAADGLLFSLQLEGGGG